MASTLAQTLEIALGVGARLEPSDQHLLKRTARAQIKRLMEGPEPPRRQLFDKTGASLN